MYCVRYNIATKVVSYNVDINNVLFCLISKVCVVSGCWRTQLTVLAPFDDTWLSSWVNPANSIAQQTVAEKTRR